MCNRLLHCRWIAGALPISHDGRYFRLLSAMVDSSRHTGEHAKGGMANMELRYWNDVPLPWPGCIVHSKQYGGFKRHRLIAGAPVGVKFPCPVNPLLAASNFVFSRT